MSEPDDRERRPAVELGFLFQYRYQLSGSSVNALNLRCRQASKLLQKSNQRNYDVATSTSETAVISRNARVCEGNQKPQVGTVVSTHWSADAFTHIFTVKSSNRFTFQTANGFTDQGTDDSNTGLPTHSPTSSPSKPHQVHLPKNQRVHRPRYRRLHLLVCRRIRPHLHSPKPHAATLQTTNKFTNQGPHLWMYLFAMLPLILAWIVALTIPL
jgi:hypothetical protein